MTLTPLKDTKHIFCVNMTLTPLTDTKQCLTWTGITS